VASASVAEVCDDDRASGGRNAGDEAAATDHVVIGMSGDDE
jgi:hypothetical protein